MNQLKSYPWCLGKAKSLFINEDQSKLRGSTNGASKIPFITEEGIKECGIKLEEVEGVTIVLSTICIRTNVVVINGLYG